mmetsp:Transcript_41815/g.100417  ORF Transcript_41815/g.100417 Transcript_41815/m.100417 type:complete len:97 (-) Transcript_41815:320-610(-)
MLNSCAIVHASQTAHEGNDIKHHARNHRSGEHVFEGTGTAGTSGPDLADRTNLFVRCRGTEYTWVLQSCPSVPGARMLFLLLLRDSLAKSASALAF